MKSLVRLMPGSVQRSMRKTYLRGLFRSNGYYTYFGQKIFAPARSAISEQIIDKGVFESDVIHALRVGARSETTVFDVGANIGVIAVAMLATRPDVDVVSFECSPSILPYLRKTHAASPHRNRWQLQEIAIAREAGELDFFTSGAERSQFDGLRDTGRGGPSRRLTVPATTLDDAWSGLRRPAVSMIKIDVEGAESDVISGSKQLIAESRPYIIFEWTKKNLKAYQRPESDIFDLIPENYQLFAVPFLTPVLRPTLAFEMARTETFLLAPVTPA